MRFDGVPERLDGGVVRFEDGAALSGLGRFLFCSLQNFPVLKTARHGQEIALPFREIHAFLCRLADNLMLPRHGESSGELGSVMIHQTHWNRNRSKTHRTLPAFGGVAKHSLGNFSPRRGFARLRCAACEAVDCHFGFGRRAGAGDLDRLRGKDRP